MKKRIAKIVGVVLALMLTLLPVTALATEGDVAQVGDTTYATLQEAVANANGQTVTLLASVSDQTTIGITDGNAVTIDLNGHDIGFAQQKHFLVSNGSVTLTGTGTVAEQSPYFSRLFSYLEAADCSFLFKTPLKIFAESDKINVSVWRFRVNPAEPARFLYESG